MRKIVFGFMLICCMGLLCGCKDKTVTAKKEYKEIEKLNLQFDYQHVEAYKIGADSKGNPVFYEPEKALEQAEKEFAEGFWYLKTEYGLQDVKTDYEDYETYSWKAETSDEVINSQCEAIGSFLSIYSNSFQ